MASCTASADVSSRRLPAGAGLALVALACMLTMPAMTRAQERGTPAGSASAGALILLAEPVAGTIRYAYVPGVVVLGVEGTFGLMKSVTVARGVSGKLDEWAAAYGTLGLRGGGIEAFAGGGAALVVGNDFSAIYPSGEAGVAYGAGKFSLRSVVRVIRIAGGNGTGEYRVRWAPLQIGWQVR